ncbi:hypothetical protein [Amycolatopsis pigmentata]|uniref:Uncharacterized protein n=1 Tax=Amycolatopsis pigmentata TaxID=450801 RepID=A0ABW5G0T2_9PSEU
MKPQTEATPRGRRRGQAVLTRLRSTDDFTNRGRLDIDERRLILFLVTVLADDEGRLTESYRALLLAHAHDNRHWTHGKTLKSLQSRASKYLGRSAERIPAWDKIVDILRVAVPHPDLDIVLADAAGLYCRAIGADRPAEDYRGELGLPIWAEADPVTVDMVQAGLRASRWLRDECPVPTYAPLPRTPVDGKEAEKDYRALLEVLIRAFRHLDAQIHDYQEDQDTQEDQEVSTLRAEIAKLREQNRILTRKNQQLTSRNMRLARVAVEAKAPEEASRLIEQGKAKRLIEMFPAARDAPSARLG